MACRDLSELYFPQPYTVLLEMRICDFQTESGQTGSWTRERFSASQLHLFRVKDSRVSSGRPLKKGLEELTHLLTLACLPQSGRIIHSDLQGSCLTRAESRGTPQNPTLSPVLGLIAMDEILRTMTWWRIFRSVINEIMEGTLGNICLQAPASGIPPFFGITACSDLWLQYWNKMKSITYHSILYAS